MPELAHQTVTDTEEILNSQRDAAGGAAAQALCEIHELAEEILHKHLQEMLKKVPDLLYSRAEMAESKLIQDQYYAAMQEMSAGSEMIEETFIRSFSDHFNLGVSRQADRQAGKSAGGNSLEEELAIANMVSRIREDCAQHLPGLDKQIGLLIRDPDLDQWHNPLGPEAVCMTFQAAIECIHGGTGIRLLMLGLFDQYVSCHLGDLYSELNRHLTGMALPDNTRSEAQAVPVQNDHAGAGEHSGRRETSPENTGPDDRTDPDTSAQQEKLEQGRKRLEAARSAAMNEIEPRTEDSASLDFVREFISGHWKNLLFMIHARQGKNSEAWKQALQTMDDLTWSVKPERTKEDRQRLLKMQLGLLKKLRAGMQYLSVPSGERDEFIARLLKAQGGTAPDEGLQPDLETGSGSLEPGAEQQPHRTDPAVTAARARAAFKQTDEDILNTVRNLKPGTWIQFRRSDGKTSRAKLSWISPITESLLFTDLKGVKAGNYSATELADLLRCARAEILDGKGKRQGASFR